jgi:hemerythrin superfamily protein
MDANEFLMQQHREVENLYDEYQEATGEAKHECGKQILTALTVHADIEEEIYYPAVQEAGDKQLVDEYKAEHAALKLHISHLAMKTSVDEEYEATMTALMEAVNQHIEEEEEEGMPEAENLLGEAKLMELGSKLEERAKELEESTIKRLWATIT